MFVYEHIVGKAKLFTSLAVIRSRGPIPQNTAS